MYKFNTPLAEEARVTAEYNVSQRQKDLNQLIEDKVVVPIAASVLLRGNKRRVKEPFEAYRRGLRNAQKALKAYRKNPDATVLINRDTMEVL